MARSRERRSLDQVNQEKDREDEQPVAYSPLSQAQVNAMRERLRLANLRQHYRARLTGITLVADQEADQDEAEQQTENTFFEEAADLIWKKAVLLEAQHEDARAKLQELEKSNVALEASLVEAQAKLAASQASTERLLAELKTQRKETEKRLEEEAQKRAKQEKAAQLDEVSETLKTCFKDRICPQRVEQLRSNTKNIVGEFLSAISEEENNRSYAESIESQRQVAKSFLYFHRQ